MRKSLILLFLLFSTFSWASDKDCPRKFKVTLETKKEMTYCKFENLMVSQDCFLKKDNCEIIKKIKSNISILKESILHGENQNPGSWACRKLELEVIMGKMWDGSELCTCENNEKQSVICTSLIL